MLAAVTILVIACAVSLCHSARVNGVGYNTARPPLSAPAYPYKGRAEDTTTISPKSVREARLVCDQTAHINRIVTCEIHTFDLCGNPTGRTGNITQWRTQVESVRRRKANLLVSPVVWISKGVARFYFTPIATGVHVVTVKRVLSLPLEPLRTSTIMTNAVTVHDSIVSCTQFNFNQPPRATQSFLWAQAARGNSRTPVYGIEASTSDRTRVFADVARSYGAGVRGDDVKQFVAPILGEIPRVDNSAFRFCDYVQRS
jgi:hypothetical protein